MKKYIKVCGTVLLIGYTLLVIFSQQQVTEQDNDNKVQYKTGVKVKKIPHLHITTTGTEQKTHFQDNHPTDILKTKYGTGIQADLLANDHSNENAQILEKCHIKYPLFQNLSHMDGFACTAYYDGRELKPMLRILMILQRYSFKPQLYCRFQKPGGLMAFTHVSYYEMCENHDGNYGGWILSCEVPKNLNSCDFDVTMKKDQIDFKVASLNIQYTSPNDKESTFGVCISPIYGSIAPATLIQYIELTTLLGAGHMTFYTTNDLYSTTLDVLKLYKDSGNISTVPWQVPMSDSEIWSHGQILAINDCLYRNMYRTKYLIFLDIDELLVPHLSTRGSTWLEIFHTILSSNFSKTKGFYFESAFFDPSQHSNETEMYHIDHNFRTKSFTKMRSKVMVEANKVFEVGIHHVSKFMDPTHEVMWIPTNTAFIQHYRQCVKDYDYTVDCKTYVKDNRLWDYEEMLWTRYSQVMKKLYGGVMF